MKKIIRAIPAVLLLALPYLLMVWLGVAGMLSETELPGDGTYTLDASMVDIYDKAFRMVPVIYIVIVLINVIWLIYQTASGMSAQKLLFWNMLIKLCYIPVFFFAFLAMLAGFATFLVGGIAMVIAMALIMLVFFIPPCFYGVCGCIRAAKEGTLNKALAVVFAILHCIGCIDVIIAIVAYCMVRSSNKKRLSGQMNANTYYNGTIGNGYPGNGYMR